MLSKFFGFGKNRTAGKLPEKLLEKSPEKSPKKTVSFSENPPEVQLLESDPMSESLDEPTQPVVHEPVGPIDEVGVSYNPRSQLLSDLSNFSLGIDQRSDISSGSPSPLLPPLPDSIMPETFADVLRGLVDNPTVPGPIGASYTAPHGSCTDQQTLVSVQSDMPIESSPQLSSVITSPMNMEGGPLAISTREASGGLLLFSPSAPPSPLLPLPLVEQENYKTESLQFILT